MRHNKSGESQLAINWMPVAPAPTNQPAPVKVAPPAPVAPPPPPPPAPPAAPPPAGGRDPIEAYLERCSLRGFSPHTIRSYRTDLTKARKHMGNLLEADDLAVRAFIESESRKGLHPGTVGRRLNTLRSFYLDARRYKLRTDDPTLTTDAPKKPKRLPKYLRDHEIAALLAVLTDDSPMAIREAAIVATFYHTGMRLSELVGLDVLVVGSATIRVFGKGSKERELPVTPALRAYLDAWLAIHPGGSALFCSLSSAPGRLSSERVREIVKGALARAGLGNRGFTPHKLRHSFASRLINNGLRIDVIQKLLGHAGIETTMMYAHTELSPSLRADLDRIL